MNFTLKYFLIILVILSFFSCQKDKTKVNKKTPKSTTINKKELRTLIQDTNFKGLDYSLNDLSLIIPANFKRKNEKLFFEENGTNLSLEKDNLGKLSVHDYILQNYKILKEDFSNTIKEEEDIIINKKEVKYIKFIIDRKKYFIQIETVIIKDKKDTYIITISGKKHYMELLSKTINNIFSSIKLKNEENILDKP